MPTARFTGTIESQITTPGFYWSATYSCADLAENFMYWFDRTNGDMFKATLPGLTGLTQIATISNISAMKAMIAHPTDANLLIFFNSTDGVGTIHSTTGAVNILFSVAAFNALIAGTSLELANMSGVRMRNGLLMLFGETDPSGAIWLWNVGAGTASLLLRSNGFQVSVENGPEANELMLSSLLDLTVYYSRNLDNDEIRMVAGCGTVANLVDGPALTVAQFYKTRNLCRMAADLYYLYDPDFNKVRWIQGGLVGSYAAGVIGGNNLCCILPGRNMAVSVDVQGVTVWS